jgi:hypothetical protein
MIQMNREIIETCLDEYPGDRSAYLASAISDSVPMIIYIALHEFPEPAFARSVALHTG